MSDLLGVLLWIAMAACWLNAIIYDINHNNALWAVVDFALAPLGVIRGLILYFS